MSEEEVEQQAEATDEPTADSGDSELAAAVDDQAGAADGSAAEAAPEVPDDASAKIAAAQQHIDNLNMDKEREAAKRSI
jgi:hypothetical protein